jgi:hypothetical protein
MSNDPHIDAPLSPAQDALIAEFTKWSADLLKTEEKAKEITHPLYHYTDAAGLKGILEHQKFWFTDYQHLNDPSEFIHGTDLIHGAIRMLSPSGADEPVRHFCEIVSSMLGSPKIRDQFFLFMIASFSYDSDDLGQWRSYADNGRGYAIGFGRKAFDVVEPTPNQQPDEKVFVGPVIYDMQERSEQITAVVNRATAVVLQAHSQGVLSNAFMQELSRCTLASPLIWYALTSKHPAYKHEQEVRLVMANARENLVPFIKTRVRGSEIVPYVEHKMPMRKPPHLLEIVVGPAAPAGAERSVRIMLDALGADATVGVNRSGIPYRAV